MGGAVLLGVLQQVETAYFDCEHRAAVRTEPPAGKIKCPISNCLPLNWLAAHQPLLTSKWVVAYNSAPRKQLRYEFTNGEFG